MEESSSRMVTGNLDGGDLADEDEGHHDAKAKSEAAETSSQSKKSKRWAGEKTIVKCLVRKSSLYASPEEDDHETQDIEKG